LNPVNHITIICSRLDLPGGTERAIADLANLLQSKGHKLTLVVLDETADSFFNIDKGVKVMQAPLNFGITNKGNILSRKILLFKHLSKLRSLLKQLNPDLIISTDYVFTISAYIVVKKLNCKILSWEHHHFYWLKRNRFWNYLYHKIYPKIDRIICLNNTEAELFQQINCKTAVIPNFVKSYTISKENTHTLLSIGWLTKRKGVDLIPEIAEEVLNRHPEWKWKIIGSGEEYKSLQKQIVDKGLAEKVLILSPEHNDLSKEYSNASLYVMTSRFECFPMVLLEAMSFGLPCIAFNCPTGPSDIIQHEKDGILVENENIDAMVMALDELVSNEEKRNKMGENAFHNVQRFSPDKVYSLWGKLINY
jgi:glycosyltransferase involved in cell wall biosynthesis